MNTCLEKMDRISSTIKLSRNEITEILYTDIKREAEHIKQLFKECDADPETKKGDVGELLAKCRAGLVDYQANVNTIDILKFATDMKNENEFMNGLQQQLVPWMDKGEKVTNVPLEKPKSFEEARETEKQIEEQRMRFKKIASVAASRVESMRDLLIRWEEMTKSVEKDALDFQPLTQFLKCYAIYFSSS